MILQGNGLGLSSAHVPTGGGLKGLFRQLSAIDGPRPAMSVRRMAASVAISLETSVSLSVWAVGMRFAKPIASRVWPIIVRTVLSTCCIPLAWL